MSANTDTSDDSADLIDIPNDSMTHDIKVNRARSIERAVDDYKVPWQGILREWMQNGGDAWGENKLKGIIPDDQTLHLRAELDTDAGRICLWDDAGGMLKTVLVDNLFALDNTSEAKADGKGAGSYGRGFWVIVGSGTKCYVETKHGDSHWAAGATTQGKHSEPYVPDDPKLTESGTYIEVQGLNEHYLDGHLDNWNVIEQMLIKNYAFLLLRDDVEVTYVIDGVEHTPDVPDLHTLADEATLRYEEELPAFTHYGEEYRIRDLVIVDATEFDGPVPWTGVAMLKNNDYLDQPFLHIDKYRPHHIPSLGGEEPQMFGWCDATDLCPDLENNSHEEFHFNKDDSGIKKVLKEVHDEHFKRTQSTSEKEEVFEEIQQKANDLLAKQSDALSGKGMPESQGAGDGDGEDDGTGDGTETPAPSPSGLSLLNCKVPPGRNHDVGDDIPLSLVVNVPAEPECDAYDIYDIEVENRTTGEMVLSEEMLTVDATPDTPTTEGFSLFDAEEGMYVFRAKIRKHAGIADPSYAKTLKPFEDKSHVYFKVGDVEPTTNTTTDETDDEDGSGPVSFIEDIEHVPVTNLEQFPFPAYAEEGAEGGFSVMLNTNWPEMDSAINHPKKDERKARQVNLGVKYAVDAVMDHMVRDDIADITDGLNTEEGHDLTEVLIEQFDARLNTLGLLELEMHK